MCINGIYVLLYMVFTWYSMYVDDI